ncbi:MAG: isoprenoid biosynthesis glyoxalase ElbB [Sphingobacteriia bacterium]|nr:isoprenoid biosynthesis glyoxalase ElbB [Sphingobacteriia bacterium]
MNKKFAVLLSGCGHLDGAEIREAVLSLLAIESQGHSYNIYAPDYNQQHVINHITGEELTETRNILVESARIARGNIQNVNKLVISKYDGLVMPGGFGAAKNYCSIASNGPNASITPKIKEIVLGFNSQKKPIGAICISPAVVALAFKGVKTIEVTLGDDNDSNASLIKGLGSKHIHTNIGEAYYFTDEKIASCAAYMRDSKLPEIYKEISSVIELISK